MPTFKSVANIVRNTIKQSSGKATRYTSCLSKRTLNVEAGTAKTVVDPSKLTYENLVACTTSGDAHALLEPLGDVILSVDPLAFSKDVERELASPVFSRAMEALASSLEPLRELHFALASHCNKADAQQWLGSIECGLGLMLRPSQSVARPLSEDQFNEVMAAWRNAVAEFFARCEEVWELHFLFVFLDVKGDQALCQHVASRLCSKFCCPPHVLARCFAQTGARVQEVLRALAGQQHKDLLERLLQKALAGWHQNWKMQITANMDSVSFSSDAEGESGDAFWTGYFSNVQSISWADFAEAFEAYFLMGPGPVDLLIKLREKVDPSQEQSVLRSRWNKVMRAHGCITKFVEALVNEVKADVGSCIFRPEPLPRVNPVQPSAAQAGQAMAALRKEQESNSSASKVVIPSTASPGMPPAEKLEGARGPSSVASTSSAATPVDRAEGLRRARGPQSNTKTTWGEICAQNWAANRPFWVASEEELSRDDMVEETTLRLEALRVVQSRVSYTNKALMLGVVSGGLGETSPIVGKSSKGATPSVVVFANGTSFNGVTRFGRENTMGLHGPDYVMGEQIASRSHFHVVFDQKTDSFSVMDAGSKWGTYVKLQGERVLSCGDWLRVGNAEFIIRYCGGTCQKSKGHRHYKLHAAKVMQDVKKARQMHSFSDGSIQARQMHSSSDGSIQEQQLQDDDAVSDEDDPTFVLGPRRRTPWTPACTRHSMQTISQNAGLETSGCLDGQQALSWPLAPLELDFISGGRMGEKLILNSRVATLGRSEDCTIPVNDTTFANVSRTHCVFEFKNGRWTIRDNNSTNGTWRRTSCILQPSRPEVLQVGGRVFAGLHELSVQEEASMTHWWAPSAGVAALSALLLRPTRDSPLRRTSITRAAFAANTLDSSDNEGTIASV